MKDFFASNKGIVVAGALIGLIAISLQKMGNPGNMGGCVVCFERDLAGSLGLHRAEVVQYARPEIFGLVLGSFLAAAFVGNNLLGQFHPGFENQPVAHTQSLWNFLGLFTAGLAAALAAALAAHLNRRAGFLAAPDPAGGVISVLLGLEQYLGALNLPELARRTSP